VRWLVVALLAAALVSPFAGAAAVAFGLALIAPVLLQCWRKRSVVMGLYSIALINFHGAGLIAGWLRPRIDPRRPIDSAIRHPDPQRSSRNQ